ncbi:MAG: L-lactate dehydrogenase [Janthinobacterium lividum]
MAQAASVSDWRERARRRLPRMLFEYIDGGAYDEVSLRRNVDSFQRVTLRQRVLTDVSQLQLGAELFGQQLAMPVVLAPVGMSGLFGRRGEVAGARAAEAAGIQMCLSTMSVCSIEEVQASVTRPTWFQLYMIRDRGFMIEMLRRAQAAAAPVLVFTVDLPVTGARYRDIRSGLSGKRSLVDSMRIGLDTMAHPSWVWNVGVKGRPHSFGNVEPAMKASGETDYIRWIAGNFDPSVSWRDLAWVRERWDGPIVIKGILDADDARMAVAEGVDGIVVSNHGGRQLDGVPATIDALPAIADAVGDALTLMLDGGVRSGLDLLKALALGAKGVMLGRAWAYALAGGGGAGVSAMLATVRHELQVAMMLTGCTDLRQANPSLLVDNAQRYAADHAGAPQPFNGAMR